MTSRERVFTALNHKEPDRVPLDFASTHISGIHMTAYQELLAYLQIPEEKVRCCFERSGTAEVMEKILEISGSDVRGVWPNKMGAEHWACTRSETDTHYIVTDEWGVVWSKDKKNGLYYDVCKSPHEQEDIELSDLEHYVWPALNNDEKFAGLHERAQRANSGGYAIFLENPMAEILHTQTKLRGYENFFMDLLLNEDVACYMMDQVLELLGDYFKRALAELSDYPLIVRTSDDLGSQSSLLLSPDTYRRLIKPRHKKLFDIIRQHAKNEVKIFFHTDGAIKELIPDFIEIGADILNPIQYSCTGMDSTTLKREFGKDLCFWGGGIDTQSFMPDASIEEVKTEVRKQLEILAPGGGFVFSQVHNFQKGISPEKMMAVWETVREFGVY